MRLEDGIKIHFLIRVGLAFFTLLLGAHVAAFDLEIREQEDSFTSIKKYNLRDGQKISIDLKRIGWSHCEVTRGEQVAFINCWVDKNKVVHSSCHRHGGTDISLLLQGQSYAMNFDLFCRR